MEFSKATEIFYECIDIVSLTQCRDQSKGFYLFAADINKFRDEVGRDYWEHLVELEQSGMGTAIDLVLCEKSQSISMVFIASGKPPDGNGLNENHTSSSPLIKFITEIEQLMTNTGKAAS